MLIPLIDVHRFINTCFDWAVTRRSYYPFRFRLRTTRGAERLSSSMDESGMPSWDTVALTSDHVRRSHVTHIVQWKPRFGRTPLRPWSCGRMWQVQCRSSRPTRAASTLALRIPKGQLCWLNLLAESAMAESSHERISPSEHRACGMEAAATATVLLNSVLEFASGQENQNQSKANCVLSPEGTPHHSHFYPSCSRDR